MSATFADYQYFLNFNLNENGFQKLQGLPSECMERDMILLPTR